MRTVWSSLAEANMCGSLGFHATALTVPEWPGSTSSSRALWRCHTYTCESSEPETTNASFAPPKAERITNFVCRWPRYLRAAEAGHG